MAREEGAITVRRRSLARDTQGLSTVEYVILLVAVVSLGVAGWRMFGRSSYAHAERASGAMSSLDDPAPHAASGGGTHTAHPSQSHLDDATGDATPPSDTDGLFGPGFLAAAALLLVAAMLVRRLQQGGGGKKT